MDLLSFPKVHPLSLKKCPGQHDWLISDDLDFNLFIQSPGPAVGEGGKAKIRTDSHQSSV